MISRIAVILGIAALATLAACSSDEAASPGTPAAATNAAPAPAPETEVAVADAPAAGNEGAAATDSPPADAAPARQTAAERNVAQGTMRFVEGQHYVRLRPQASTSTEGNQVEVAEVFAYSCPGCYRFEPYVQDWESSMPDYVNFVRIPAAWNELLALHARAYYTAESLGKIEEMHDDFFREMHVNGNYLQSTDALIDFFDRYDVDEEQFLQHFNSMGVRLKVSRAAELAESYNVPGTPAIVVEGKYLTGDGIETYGEWFDVIDELTAMEWAARSN